MTNDRGLLMSADMGERLRVMEARRHPAIAGRDTLNAAESARREKNKRYLMHSSPPKKIELPYEVTGYTEGLSIRNNTGRSISLRGRDNTIFHLGSNPMYDEAERGIYYTLGFSGSDMLAIDHSRHDGVRNLTSNKLMQLSPGKGKRWMDIEGVKWWYFISLDELTSKGGTVYLEEIDKLISLADDDKIPDHPFTYTSVDEHITEALREYGDTTAGLILYVVDNAEEFGKRYINLNGNIMIVPPRLDPNKRNGVYLKLNGHIGNQRRGVEFYEFDSLDDKCPIKFFATIAEAENFGSELEEKKRQHELAKAEVEVEVLDAKRDQQLTSIEVSKTKDQLDEAGIVRKDLYESKSLRRKDKYDESSTVRKDEYDARSTDRKEEAEETKAVLATVGAAAAIGGIGYKVLAGGGKKFMGDAITRGVITSGLVRGSIQFAGNQMVNRTLQQGVLATIRSAGFGGNPLAIADGIVSGVAGLLIGD